jgi:hypothetical protein
MRRVVALKKAKNKLITQKQAAAELGVRNASAAPAPSLKERGDRAVIHAAADSSPLSSFNFYWCE